MGHVICLSFIKNSDLDKIFVGAAPYNVLSSPHHKQVRKIPLTKALLVDSIIEIERLSAIIL